MPRYHLTIEYDGSQLRGWQRQKIIPTGQKILEQAIDDYCQEDVTLVAAGRTDAGVHALGQSVHVDLQLNRSCRDITRGLNAHLRNTPLVVLSVRQVSPTFHARFDALRRHYCYVVCCRLAPPLLWRGRAWHQPFSLNLQAMEEAASMMEGLHDFSLFRSSSCQGGSPIRTIERVQIMPFGGKEQMIRIHFQAKAFLQKQVRFLVGALILIGKKDGTITALGRHFWGKKRHSCLPNSIQDPQAQTVYILWE